MRQLIFILTTLILQFDLYGQKKDVYETPIPRNIDQCFKTLDKTMPDKEIELIRTLHEDSIYDHDEFKSFTDFFHAWKLYEGSRLTKYFNKKGLMGSSEIYEIILVSYHRHLNNKELDLNGQIKKYQAIQKSDYEHYLSRLDKDTLNGIYIPKDINECMTELDRLLNKESKDKFMIEEEAKAVSDAYRPGVGLWIRNNWGLWSGSRLQKYFFDKGAKDPEGISWIILTCYHRHLNGRPLDLEGQIKKSLE